MALSDSDPSDITYILPVDAGAAGKAYAASLQKKLAERGRTCKLFPHSTKSKLIRFRPLASVCEGGFVSTVSAEWNDWFFDELEAFVGDGKTHDDALDAAVVAFWGLNNVREYGNIALPTLISGEPSLQPNLNFSPTTLYNTNVFSIPTFNL